MNHPDEKARTDDDGIDVLADHLERVHHQVLQSEPSVDKYGESSSNELLDAAPGLQSATELLQLLEAIRPLSPSKDDVPQVRKDTVSESLGLVADTEGGSTTGQQGEYQLDIPSRMSRVFNLLNRSARAAMAQSTLPSKPILIEKLLSNSPIPQC